MINFWVKVILIICDLFTVFFSLILAYFVRTNLIPLNYNGLYLKDYINFFPIYLIIILLFFKEGIYYNRFSFEKELKKIIKSLVYAFFVIFTFLALLKTNLQYSRFIIIFSFILMTILVPLEKYIIKNLLFKLGIWKLEVFNLDNEFSNKYIGFVKSHKKSDYLFINSKNVKLKELSKIINDLNNYNIIFTPIINGYDYSSAEIDILLRKRENLIFLKNNLQNRYLRIIKLISDYLLSLLLLPFILPLIFIISLLIKIESKGPIFYVQKRIGYKGKPFYIIKFRTMYIDFDFESYLKKNETAKNEWETFRKLKRDPRITRIGKFLRKTSLDELPQIFNILKGEMSLVGPRAVTQEEIEKYYKENKKFYFSVKPGLTGLWQVSGRNQLSYEERVEIDKWYTINWSIWLDFIILLKTIKVVLFREGAY